MKHKTQPRKKFTARTADKHVLYQLSVQDPAFETAFINRVYKKAFGRLPLSLREDFCGTALLCAHWAKSRPDRTATGLDIDKQVLAWGNKHNIAPLGADGARVTLLNQNVLAPVPARFDVIAAYNFSYFCFKTRELLRQYFRAVRRSMGKQSVFMLDAYGGSEAQEDMTEHTKQKGFTYVWDQYAYNPINSHAQTYIHFEFPDGTKMHRAFGYDWRLWQLAEIQEVLHEAGFAQVQVYWEGEDADGSGNGIFRATTRASNDPCWNAYLVARP